MIKHSWTDNICTICGCERNSHWNKKTKLNSMFYYKDGFEYEFAPTCLLIIPGKKSEITFRQRLTDSEIELIKKNTFHISNEREIFRFHDKKADPEVEKVIFRSAGKINWYKKIQF